MMIGKKQNNEFVDEPIQSPAYNVEIACRDAEAAVNTAIQELGKAYYEGNKDNEDSEYYEQIVSIKKYIDKAKLWNLYRLSLDGKTKCEKCGAILTDDSVFCNKCGSPIEASDFSSLMRAGYNTTGASNAAVCPVCGRPIAAGAIFCESCGTKIQM